MNTLEKLVATDAIRQPAGQLQGVQRLSLDVQGDERTGSVGGRQHPFTLVAHGPRDVARPALPGQRDLDEFQAALAGHPPGVVLEAGVDPAGHASSRRD